LVTHGSAQFRLSQELHQRATVDLLRTATCSSASNSQGTLPRNSSSLFRNQAVLWLSCRKSKHTTTQDLLSLC
jgi:hypothetical protein